ncbi:MAG: LPS assembly protein LptD [Candidatus Omnitrophota bacterium]
MKRLMIELLIVVAFAGGAFAQEEVSPVEVNGDKVEFDIKDRKVIATGNVSIVKDNVRLTADKVEFYRETGIAKAYGHVVVEREGERIEGENLVFNFETMKGDFDNPLVTAPPLYGSGKSVEKVGEDHYRIKDGFITTSDWDDPETRITGRTIDVYTGDVAVARRMVFKVGHVPVFFWPKYTEDLKERSSIVRLMPGYSSDWGLFLLSRWRFDRNENFKTFVHLDYRERKGLGWGVDNEYNTRGFGEGSIRTYYTHERNIGNYHFWQDHGPVIEKERYKVEWRHRWQIDERTMAVSQLYKLSDATFIKDYFEGEYETDQTPASYALVTHALPYATLSGRADYRVNRFVSTVERLPEISYIMPSLEIFDSNFYWENTTTYSNLKKKDASPVDAYPKTERFDVDNEVSYPKKIGFIETRPFVGTRHTYYSRTKEPMMQNEVRGLFRTGVDLSTKFYRIFNAQTNAFKLNINQIRHVITPSVAYLFQDDPTVQPGELDQYDSVDQLTRLHRATLSLENKLQTKRNETSVDLARMIVSSDFAFKQDELLKSSFNNLNFDLEITPYDWLKYYFDLTYNPQTQNLETLNFDLYINNPSDLWYFRIGDRYHHQVDNLLVTEVGWKINPKWSAVVNLMHDLDTGKNKEQNFALRRDLHAWVMDIRLSNEKFDGQELMFIFTLKGFEDVIIEGGKSIGKGITRPGVN